MLTTVSFMLCSRNLASMRGTSAYHIEVYLCIMSLYLLYYAWANQRRRQYCIPCTVQFKVQLTYAAPREKEITQAGGVATLFEWSASTIN